MGLIRTGKPRGDHYRTRNPRNKAAKASSIMAAIVQAQCAMRIAPVASTKASGRVSLKAGAPCDAFKKKRAPISAGRAAGARARIRATHATSSLPSTESFLVTLSG